MSKKDFSNANPAMAFISQPSQPNQMEEFNLTQPTKKELEAKLEAASQSTPKARAKAKPRTKATKATKKEVIPMKRNPEFIETKSKRVQMLMQPSVYNAIKEISEQKGISINETMHEILKHFVEQD